jgi:hypothetical protein
MRRQSRELTAAAPSNTRFQSDTATLILVVADYMKHIPAFSATKNPAAAWITQPERHRHDCRQPWDTWARPARSPIGWAVIRSRSEWSADCHHRGGWQSSGCCAPPGGRYGARASLGDGAGLAARSWRDHADAGDRPGLAAVEAATAEAPKSPWASMPGRALAARQLRGAMMLRC